ncbi:hypothetical protein NL676_007971 [Syzygium grande]|nr:hypothetical protein NL676_007971 [Syzygium grande]
MDSAVSAHKILQNLLVSRLLNLGLLLAVQSKSPSTSTIGSERDEPTFTLPPRGVDSAVFLECKSKQATANIDLFNSVDQIYMVVSFNTIHRWPAIPEARKITLWSVEKIIWPVAAGGMAKPVVFKPVVAHTFIHSIHIGKITPSMMLLVL